MMTNPIILWKQFLSGAINGFIFGVTCEACLFAFLFIKAGGVLNEMRPTLYFQFPLLALFVVAVVKVIAYKLFRIVEDSVLNGQFIGLLCLLGYVISGQIRFFIMNTFYGYKWSYHIYLSELIIGLIAISIFNLFYSIIKSKFDTNLKLK